MVKKGDGYVYRYGNEERPVITSTITVPYKTSTGMARRQFTIFRTHHGPVVRQDDGKWVSVRLMQEPLKALTQSYTRTKARDYKAFRQTMELHTNSSNNTIFADADGNIAYFHANFIPRRDTQFDWTRPADGSNPATEWKGLLSIDETPGLLNPANGWLYNSNNWPWTAAGPSSPKKADYPAYVESGGENPRGLHAIRVFQNRKDFTLDSLVSAAYDSYLAEFQNPIPRLLDAYDKRHHLQPPEVEAVRPDRSAPDLGPAMGCGSVPTTLARLLGRGPLAAGRRHCTKGRRVGLRVHGNEGDLEELLDSLAAASDRLTTDFGTWRTTWGEVNRFQRLNDNIDPSFDDAGPSIPVGFTSARWGSLASFGARTFKGTRKMYGTSGNSFVAAVEFGDRVRARAITAGGESGDRSSPHFNDQALRYSTGDLREVYFYRAQLEGHIERQYHPGGLN